MIPLSPNFLPIDHELLVKVIHSLKIGSHSSKSVSALIAIEMLVGLIHMGISAQSLLPYISCDEYWDIVKDVLTEIKISCPDKNELRFRADRFVLMLIEIGRDIDTTPLPSPLNTPLSL